MNKLVTDVLVVGGSTGGTAAALQAARRGTKTVLVSEFPWLGGMLTSAGVSAPDGNELAAFQTGIWGAFLQELQRRQPEGLDHGWVSFFTYDPRIGAQIFADWVQQLPNLQWIVGTPLEVLKQGNCVTGVRFEDYTVHAKLTLDGTELGDLLALGEIPYRWGWELQSQWEEPSAPTTPNALTQNYPVQAPTWIVVLQDFGVGVEVPVIPAVPQADLEQFVGAWDGYSPEQFLNYGRLPGNLFMLNWPQRGNDYGRGLERLVESKQARLEFLQETRWHSQNFARFIQTQLGQRYGLATEVFPYTNGSIGGGAYALHPYYRESRRLQGLVTIKEQDILPLPAGRVAPLPLNRAGQVEAIAIGNYANDHHYPGIEFPLKPKSIRWGGRWTGTPFTIPYGSLVPVQTDGLLVCEKNISVSHIANGATRLQPVVLGIGQAAGMAAALCIQRGCQPRDLPIRVLQEALLQDPIAPAAIAPLLNLTPTHPSWLHWQRYYLDHPEAYPSNGDCPSQELAPSLVWTSPEKQLQEFTGTFHRQDQSYTLTVSDPNQEVTQTWMLVTLQPQVSEQLQTCFDGQMLTVQGWLNSAGNWLRVQVIEDRFSKSAAPRLFGSC
jgi:hypothetical protein